MQISVPGFLPQMPGLRGGLKVKCLEFIAAEENKTMCSKDSWRCQKDSEVGKNSLFKLKHLFEKRA